MNEENVIKNVKNKNNSFLQNKIIKLKDITNETKNFSSKKYLKILNKILSKLKNYMKLNECMSQEDFHEIYKENKGQNKTNIIRRNLIEMQEDKPFIKDNFENLLSLNNYQEKYEYDINLKNDILYDEYQQSSIEINVNDNKYEIANVKHYNNLIYIIRQIISLNKASRSLANKLYYNIREYLLKINDEITNNITLLNKLINYQDLEEFFNFTLSYDNLKIVI